MKEVSIYIAITPNTPRASVAAGGYILEYQTTKGPATLRGFETFCDATKHQTELRTLIAALRRIREKGICLRIYTDATYVAAALEQGWTQHWAESGWKTTRGAPVKNEEEWKELLELLAGQAFCFETGTSHPYREWLEWEISKKCNDKKSKSKEEKSL